MATSARSVAFSGRSRYGLSPVAGASPHTDGFHRGVALVTFTALLASTIALNAFKIGGFPIRGMAAAGVLGLAFLFWFDVAKSAFSRNALLLGLAAGLAALGAFVSAVNGTPAGEIVRGLMEVHAQAAITIVVAAILAQVAGARACAIAIVAVVGVSALVAVAQMMDVESAWTFRRSLGPLPDEAEEGFNFVERRPVGLSFSPIQLSTHLCLAFAVFVAVRDEFRRGTRGARTADPVVMLALAVLFGACIASATRSPILGGLIFLAIYAIQRRTSWLPMFLALAAILLYLAWPLVMGVVETNAPRVARTDDDSASARITMVYYGLRLFADNPLGYGLAFAPMTLWNSYWPDLYLWPAPAGVRVHDLHNYVMNMLNMYGLGLLLLAPIVAKLLRRAGTSVIFFIPYIVHILFHNSGPFYNDSVIWFVTAAIAAAGLGREQASDAAFAPAAPTRPGRLQPGRPSLRNSVAIHHTLHPR